MKRLKRIVVSACAALALVTAAGPEARANVQFNFNSDAEGWTFGTMPPASGTATPIWQFAPGPSSNEGSLQATLTASGSGAGAWAMSPCLEIENQSQDNVHVDFSHFTQFPANMLGQVQFRIDTTGTGFSNNWQGIPQEYWDPVNHVLPEEQNVFSPLLSSSGTSNDWWAFSGTNVATNNPQGPHVLSAFTIPLAPYSLANGTEIQFRLLLGVNADFPTPLPDVLWELNSFQVDGVKLCAVPEPAALALVGTAIAVGLARLRFRRTMSRGKDDPDGDAPVLGKAVDPGRAGAEDIV